MMAGSGAPKAAQSPSAQLECFHSSRSCSASADRLWSCTRKQHNTTHATQNGNNASAQLSPPV